MVRWHEADSPSVQSVSDNTAVSNAPLSPEQLSELSKARLRGRKIRRAARVARISGWTTAVFASFSILAGVFSLLSLALGVGLAAIAWGEFRGARLLEQADVRGPKKLALNQVVFAAMICAYGVWGIYATLTTPSALTSQSSGDAQVDAMMSDMMGPYEDLMQLVMIGMYASLIPISVAVQGGTAWYYASRTRHVRAYRDQTPGWVLQVERLAHAA